jgi:hypothetical protein
VLTFLEHRGFGAIKHTVSALVVPTEKGTRSILSSSKAVTSSELMQKAL